LNNINAKSTIYEKKEGEGARVYLLRSIWIFLILFL
jgi:hypothetical protein